MTEELLFSGVVLLDELATLLSYVSSPELGE